MDMLTVLDIFASLCIGFAIGVIAMCLVKKK